jgi:hypothetical protein
MTALKGEDLASVATENEVREVVGKGKRDGQPSRPSPQTRQTIPAAHPTCANPICTRSIERRARGRARRFCSDNCRIRAHRISLHIAPISVPGATALAADELNAPAACHRKIGNFVTSDFSGLDTPENRPSVYRGGIQGPRSALQTEIVHGRKWTEIISSSGVRSYISRVSERALRDGGAP